MKTEMSNYVAALKAALADPKDKEKVRKADEAAEALRKKRNDGKRISTQN